MIQRIRKKTNYFIAPLILLLLSLFLFGLILKVFYSQSTDSENKRQIYLGAWTYQLWNEDDKKANPEALKRLESKLDTKFAIAHVYTGWEELANVNTLNEIKKLSDSDWTPMVSINPYFGEKCTSDLPLYQAIAQGRCDQLMHEIGANLKEFEKPIFLRFAWEANIKNIEWSIVNTHSTPEDFKNAWIKFYDISKEEGANNVIWVFSVNTIQDGSVDYDKFYPGDMYVDWLGIDGYNWGETQSWSMWQDFDSVFSTSYNILIRLSDKKPVMISEVNSSDIGGDKAKWLEDMLQAKLPNKYHRIQAVVFFNEDKTAKENVDWRFETSQKNLDILKESLNSSIYKKSFP